jgi:hypothetical protein
VWLFDFFFPRHWENNAHRRALMYGGVAQIHIQSKREWLSIYCLLLTLCFRHFY